MTQRLFVFLFLLFSMSAGAVPLAPQGITLQGTILTPAGLPEEANSVSFLIQIRSPGSENCLLYSESHTLNMSGSGGAFTLTMGAGSRATGNFADSSTLAQIFNNSSLAMTSLTCSSGTSYTPASSDSRKVVITFDDGSGSQTLTQSLSVQAVPFSLYADEANALQGKNSSDFVQVNTTSGKVLSQASLESVFSSSANLTELLALIAGTSTQYTTLSGSPTFSGNVGVTGSLTASGNLYGSSAASGNLTIDSTSNASKGNIILGPTGGKVGIGTSTPATALEVKGDVTLSTGASRAINVGGVTAGNGNDLTVSAGASTVGSGGTLLLKSGSGYTGASSISMTGSGFNGGSVSIAGGWSDTNGTAGNVTIQAGGSGGNAIGGKTTVRGGSGGSSNQNGGPVNIAGGAGGGSGSYGDVLLGWDGGAARGKVGVGLGVPTYVLDVNGARSAWGYVVGVADSVTAFNSTPGGGLTFNGKIDAGGTYANFSGLRGIKENTNSGDYAGALIFDTRPVSMAPAERMRITSTGNVGIGTTTPAQKLEVNGAIKIASTSVDSAGSLRWDGTNFQGYNGTSWMNFLPNVPAAGACDQTQTFSVAGTHGYTVPASYDTITIKLWGGGGSGGAAYQGTTTLNGNNGNNTSVASLGLIAGGGGAGLASQTLGSIGGIGGTASGGTINTVGNAASSVAAGVLGAGANSPNGGTGGSSNTQGNSGNAGSAPGAGGAGAAYGATPSASGGGSGGYVEKTFNSGDLTPGSFISDIVVGSGGASIAAGVWSGAGAVGRVSITCVSGTALPANDRGIVFWNSGKLDSNTNFIFDGSGKLGIGNPSPSYVLDVTGDINSTTALRIGGTQICTSAGCTSSSDIRLKQNITPIENPLDKILQLTGVEYDWINAKKYSDKHQIGLIAQEVERIFPEVVYTDSKTGLKSIAYDHLVAPMIDSIKQLNSDLTKEKIKNEDLKKEIDDLKKRMDRLEK